MHHSYLCSESGDQYYNGAPGLAEPELDLAWADLARHIMGPGRLAAAQNTMLWADVHAVATITGRPRGIKGAIARTVS